MNATYVINVHCGVQCGVCFQVLPGVQDDTTGQSSDFVIK